jgi:hypothetical protein
MAKPQISAIVLFCVAAAAVLCALPAHVSAARDLKKGFIVQGRVFCDTCRVGFETPASTYIAGNLTFSPLFIFLNICLLFGCARLLVHLVLDYDKYQNLCALPHDFNYLSRGSN